MRRCGVVWIVLVLALIAALVLTEAPALPRCEEDAVIVGAGDFTAGLWSEYVCGPALDDFRP